MELATFGVELEPFRAEVPVRLIWSGGTERSGVPERKIYRTATGASETAPAPQAKRRQLHDKRLER